MSVNRRNVAPRYDIALQHIVFFNKRRLVSTERELH